MGGWGGRGWLGEGRRSEVGVGVLVVSSRATEQGMPFILLILKPIVIAQFLSTMIVSCPESIVFAQSECLE